MIFRKELILLSVTLLPCIFSQAQNPFVHLYTVNEGLPSNAIQCILQDDEKFIWFSTRGGLVRYDGSGFKAFTSREGLIRNFVPYIKTDSYNRVWFFCSGSQLNYFYQNKIHNRSDEPFLDSLRGTWNFIQDRQGNLYFYAYHARYIKMLDKNNHVKIYELPSLPLESDSITDDGMNIQYLTRIPSGDYLIWTYTGIYKMKELSERPVQIIRFDRYHNIDPVNDTLMYDMIAYPESGSTLLTKYLNGVPVDTTFFTEASLDKSSNILEDDNGDVWLNSAQKGIYCLRNKKIIYHLDIKKSEWICKDHEGNIWATSQDGAYKISPEVLLTKHLDNSYFPGEGVYALSADPGGRVFGISGNRIFLYENGELYNKDVGYLNCLFRRIDGLKNNMLMINSDGSDYYVLKDVTADPVTKTLRSSEVIPVFKGALATYTVNKQKDEVTLFNQYKFQIVTYSVDKHFREINKVPVSDATTHVFYDARDELVIRGYYHKDSIIQNKEKVPCYDFTTLSYAITTEHGILDSDADLFLSMYDSLYLVNMNQHLTFNLTSSFDQALNTPVNRFTYHSPVLYLATYRNIYQIEDPLNIKDNRSIPLRLMDINFSDIRDILACNDSLYIGSADGLTIIPVDLINKIQSSVPVPYFAAISANDSKTDPYAGLLTLRGKNKISFEFGSIDYSRNPVLFSYMLEGFDNEWNTGTIKGIAYANLPAGRYRFLLKAGKSNSPWSDPVEFTINIQATFWQLPLFYVLLSLFVAGLISLTVLAVKNRQLKKREMEHQLVTLEQKALQSMMNPHFLFNTLGSIQNFLLQNKPGEAGLYLSQFARLIRQNMQSIHSAMISLDAEIERLKNYLELERFRMDNRFEYKFIIDENLDEDVIMIPSMITQPFVENCILHGISPLESGGLITVSISLVTENTIKIIVEDNGVGVAQSKAFGQGKRTHLHMSMEMTRKRIEILGKKYRVKTSLEVSDAFPGSPNPGTRVTIVLPVSYEKET
ncbi:MAG TPA: histidine kinase [Bacteroidales bacterium]|nr:histidine kinase [Bacteroidales bacterium]HRZ20191.1 histidine kinase [Bacteroidales bacterium]